MKNVLALIYSSEFNENNYDSLCKIRPDYMLPFGCRYRIIDFALSNITNYDITSAILYGGYNLRSTLDHVGDGRNWELNRRRGGLMINPPVYDRAGNINELENFYSTMKFFEDNRREYVFITNPMYITKVDILDAYEKMISEDLDCLVFSKKVKDDFGFYLNRKIIITDSDDEPTNVGLNLGLYDEFDLFSGSIFMKKTVFMDLIRHSIQENNSHDILQAMFNYPKDISIGLYRSDKELEVIMDTLSYYDANRKLLNRDYFNKLFYTNGLV